MKLMADYQDIVITNQCNLNCIFCKTKSEKIFFKELSEIKAEIDLAYQNKKVPRITGGEPMLHPNFFEIFKYLDSKEINAVIESNGILLNDEEKFRQIKNVLNKKKIIFDFLITNFNNISHDFLTQKDGSFFELIKVLNSFKNENIPFYMHTVINKINYRYLEQIAKLMKSYGAKEIRLIFILPYSKVNEKFDMLVPFLSLIKNPLIDSIMYIITKEGTYVYVENIPYCVIPYFEKYIQKVDLSFPLKKNEEICSFCIFKKICFGFYEWYLEKRANDEYVSIGYHKGEKIESLERIIIDEYPFLDNPYHLGIDILDPKKRPF